jgi:hypothetical protein
MASAPPPVTAAAPLDAAQLAVEHTRRHLFPFRFERWLALGFVAFLDQCGRSGGGGFNAPAPGGGGGGGDGAGAGVQVERMLAWLGEHVLLVSVLAAGALALVVVISAVVLWINSRGVFMYADNVASGRADVARPWREHAGHASSYFAWSFALAMGTMTVVLLLVLAGGVAALFLFRGRPPSSIVAGVAVIAVLVFVLLAVVVAAALFSLALRDFVAPLQVQTGRPCGEALRIFLRLVRAHPGVFVVYVLLKIGFAVVVGLAMLVVGCGTCCCGFLPVVAQTILQPFFYFERAWSLYLLRQLGHDLLPAAA